MTCARLIVNGDAKKLMGSDRDKFHHRLQSDLAFIASAVATMPRASGAVVWAHCPDDVDVPTCYKALGRDGQDVDDMADVKDWQQWSKHWTIAEAKEAAERAATAV